MYISMKYECKTMYVRQYYHLDSILNILDCILNFMIITPMIITAILATPRFISFQCSFRHYYCSYHNKYINVKYYDNNIANKK